MVLTRSMGKDALKMPFIGEWLIGIAVRFQKVYTKRKEKANGPLRLTEA